MYTEHRQKSELFVDRLEQLLDGNCIIDFCFNIFTDITHSESRDADELPNYLLWRVGMVVVKLF